MDTAHKAASLLLGRFALVGEMIMEIILAMKPNDEKLSSGFVASINFDIRDWI
jgi:hypothetical protein